MGLAPATELHVFPTLAARDAVLQLRPGACFGLDGHLTFDILFAAVGTLFGLRRLSLLAGRSM